MRKNRIFAVLVALVASLTAFTAAPVSAREAPSAPWRGSDRERSLPPAEVGAIEQIVQGVLAQGGTGVTVVVDAPSRGRLERSWGVADLATGAALRPDQNVRVASITKTYVASALLRLVDLGRLRLDDPVGRYVTGLPNGDRITIRQLLGMRSGLPDYTQDPEFLTAFTADLALPGWDEHRVLDLIRSRPAAFEPGSKTVYNNSNYVVAGFVLERVTGLPAEWATALLVNLPLGLWDTRFAQGTSLPRPFARSYAAIEPPVDVTALNADAFWTAGAVTSKAPEVARWMRHHARGTLLSPRLDRELLATTPVDGAEDLLGYGLGVLRIGEWVGHDGYLPAYESFAVHHAETDTTIVVIANFVGPQGPGAATGIALEIAERLAPGSLPVAPPAAATAVGRLGR